MDINQSKPRPSGVQLMSPSKHHLNFGVFSSTCPLSPLDKPYLLYSVLYLSDPDVRYIYNINAIMGYISFYISDISIFNLPFLLPAFEAHFCSFSSMYVCVHTHSLCMYYFEMESCSVAQASFELSAHLNLWST